ncbi:uncharacterized protein [Littorina saxatilis]|uniref:BZIP domain-containing protein n=2 Tax=Littorina saxatilis TaxID=31220 RepID=A0AAN9GCU7_9CAEN
MIECEGRREMAENGDSIRSSTATPPLSTTTTTTTATSTPPPPSSSPQSFQHHHHHSNGHWSSPKTDQDTMGQQRPLAVSPVCNGYIGDSPRQHKEEKSVGKNCDEGVYVMRSPSADSKVSKVSKEEFNGKQQVVVKQETDQDGPLDFSLRRRDSVSESFTDDSRASSSLSPPPPSYGGVEGPPSSRHSPDADHALHLHHNNRHPHHHHNHNSQEEQDLGYGRHHNGRSPGSSPDVAEYKTDSKSGRRDDRGEEGGPRLPHNSSLAALGMMADGSGSGMTSAAVAAMLGQNGGMMGSLGNMSAAAFMARGGGGGGGDPRGKTQGGNGGKMQRPFKAYPKEALQMPLGYLGLPGVNPLASMDPSFLQGLSASQDEIMSIYKQQVEFLKEREKQMMSYGKIMSGSPPSSSASTSTSTSSSTSSASTNGSSMTHPLPPPPHSSSITHPSAQPPPPLIKSSSPSPAPYFSPPSHNHSASLPPPHTPTSLSYDHLSSAFPTPTGPPLVSSTSSLSGGSGSRKRPRSLPDEQKDGAYWERRRKNNDAAKRSRDARRAKEDEIAIRAALLEQENLKLRVEVASLKTETARLRCMIFNT